MPWMLLLDKALEPKAISAKTDLKDRHPDVLKG